MIPSVIRQKRDQLATADCQVRWCDDRGEPAIRAAHRVGPSGAVVGVDIAEEMLGMAAERAAREGVSNLDLRQTAAEALEGVPTGYFDVTLARWCLMYFDAPVAALSAARRTMRPGGRIVAAVWAEPEKGALLHPRNRLRKLSLNCAFLRANDVSSGRRDKSVFQLP